MSKITQPHFMSSDRLFQERSHYFSVQRVGSLATLPAAEDFLATFLTLSHTEREKLQHLAELLAVAPADARDLAEATIRQIGGSRERLAECLRDVDQVIDYLRQVSGLTIAGR